MNYLSDSIADFYVKKNIIRSDEKEVYKFGISLILNDIVTFSLILVFSALLSKFRFGAEFLITFCFTRIFTGGYHARKAYLCRLSMLLIAFLVILISLSINTIPLWGLAVILAASFLVVLPFIPVKHPNKELTPKLIRKGRIGGTLMYAVLSAVSVCVFLCLSVHDALVIALSLSAVSVLVVIGKFTNERSETE